MNDDFRKPARAPQDTVDGQCTPGQTTVRPVLEGGPVCEGAEDPADITPHTQALEERRRREDLERLVATVFSELVAARASDIDPTIERALELIGRYVGADRAYVFLFTDDLAAMNNTQEWCAPGIEPQKDRLQALPSATLPWWVAHLKAGKTISIPVVAEMPPEAGAERAILEMQGIQSLIVVPMEAEGRLLGFLGFDAVSARRMWLDSERDLLRSLGNTIVHALRRCQAEEELCRAEQKYRLLYQQFRGILNVLPDAIYLLSRDLKIFWANDVAAANMGVSAPEFLGQHCYESRYGCSAPCEGCPVLQSFESGETMASEEQTPDGRTWEVHAVPVYGESGEVANVIMAARDITERKRDEAERAKLQAQLAQAQKMESIGRLAGGVAHDFNNMLTVILGQAELAIERARTGHPVVNELQAISRAAERSAGLTRQLLAFARRQPVAPQVLDLNEVVEGTLKMLRRLIGEDIDLAWRPGQSLWPVKIDPSQIDQILANLCVNARDAIGDTGTVTIETGNVTIDDEYCAAHVGFLPGEFVAVAVSDDGCGMDAATLARLFEPFFTTKEQGKGTGLGLATVYGIVKQNNGFVNVYSEPGRGSTFRIYLPRHRENAAERPAAEPAHSPAGRHATILVVEDEPAILHVVKTMLERQGHTVLAASSPDEAIRIAATHPGEIRLLLTDVIMPGMNGRELANRLLASQPNLEPLFMSGYTANVIAHHGVLEEGVLFIAKPFSAADLCAKVEEILSRTR
ncbi:MAG TPA: ATP-binding protein [Thermoanaerobaculaceae bacterium]|nr:ATP-binding protein [Thermoanaerobaculaceae bacterium]HRS15964.1 ATP-binding protein [Thermoanaerobaculaceae bacterium]